MQLPSNMGPQDIVEQSWGAGIDSIVVPNR